MRTMQRLSDTDVLKKKIMDNVDVNDQVVCVFCDELISVAGESHDWQSVAFGYIWRADYYYYVESDLKGASRELYYAQSYIDEEEPSELLEKYYTLRHVICEDSYDILSAFQYCLKALDIAERLDIRYRVGANYGNLGTYYLEYDCYELALRYSSMALDVIRSLQEKKPGIMCLLLCNLIKIYLKLSRCDQAKAAIEELQSLPLKKKDLQIYVDYGYMMYEAAIGNA